MYRFFSACAVIIKICFYSLVAKYLIKCCSRHVFNVLIEIKFCHLKKNIESKCIYNYTYLKLVIHLNSTVLEKKLVSPFRRHFISNMCFIHIKTLKKYI